MAPPYDVIPDSEVPRYEAASPNNVIRLIRPGTDYARAAGTLDDWLAQGVLREDPPSVYVHEVDLGGGRTRRGVMAALRLEPYERRIVLPHERTHAGPKEGRLNLLRARMERGEEEAITRRRDESQSPNSADVKARGLPTSERQKLPSGSF